MYKIIRYRDDMTIHQVISDVLEVVVEDSKISWKDAEGQKEIQGDSLNLIVVDNAEVVGNTGELLDSTVIAKDQKYSLKSELSKVIEQLKMTQNMLDFQLGL